MGSISARAGGNGPRPLTGPRRIARSRENSTADDADQRRWKANLKGLGVENRMAVVSEPSRQVFEFNEIRLIS